MNALNYINGVFVNAVEGLTIPNINPATGQQIGTLTRSNHCLLYTSPSPRDQRGSRMPSSA